MDIDSFSFCIHDDEDYHHQHNDEADDSGKDNDYNNSCQFPDA